MIIDYLSITVDLICALVLQHCLVLRLINLITASKTSSKKESAQETFINSNPLGGTMSERKRQRIFDTLNEEIGSHWRDLGRFLDMKEGFIDEIESQNIPLRAKVTKLIEKYIEAKADPQKWFFALCEALELARRKDIAKSLQEIMSMNI